MQYETRMQARLPFHFPNSFSSMLARSWVIWKSVLSSPVSAGFENTNLGPLILVAGFCLAPVAQQHQAIWASDGVGRDLPFNRACSQLPSRERFFFYTAALVRGSLCR